ncbi:MAG: type II toxin-antitoxin system RelE/ParE family toxin [Candidatus Lokiarchaeota archaeon]|nr:type II toxin-antitoxin system RelE/ParE family toxin [Candidatus Lokiarchaeota archaeon]
MVKIEWSPVAQNDLNEVIDYIAKDSLEYALTFYEQVREKVQNLIQFPKIGRKIPELDDPAIRELILRNYRIIYRIHKSNIEIVRIIHGSRILDYDKII